MNEKNLNRREFIFGLAAISAACGSSKSPNAPSDPAQPSPSPSPSESALRSSKLFVDPNSQAANFVRSNSGSQVELIKKISEQPSAFWLTNFGSSNLVRSILVQANANGALAVLTLYFIPNRDCQGGFSSGGARSNDEYRNWISIVAGAVSGNRCAFVIEPDALAHDCSATESEERAKLLQYALATLPNSIQTCYLDAGHPAWHSANEMANRLAAAGIERARGFSLNVSNFRTTSECVGYGNEISRVLESKGLGIKYFVIDTSRNGKGPNGSEWCNPAGRALGERPNTSPTEPLVDAFLWIKRPGESDGQCNGGPRAGQFWPEYAAGLASRAEW